MQKKYWENLGKLWCKIWSLYLRLRVFWEGKGEVWILGVFAMIPLPFPTYMRFPQRGHYENNRAGDVGGIV